MSYFNKLVTGYPMRCYVEVSKNHGYTIGEVIRNKFHPQIRLLIQYYNHVFHMEHNEYEKMKKEQKELDKGGENEWQTTN